MDCKNYCQSCGMPLGDSTDFFGDNADGSKNEDYCKYCFKNGSFTADVSMDEMIEVCVPHMISANSDINEEEARRIMSEFFPQLKRWKSN